MTCVTSPQVKIRYLAAPTSSFLLTRSLTLQSTTLLYVWIPEPRMSTEGTKGKSAFGRHSSLLFLLGPYPFPLSHWEIVRADGKSQVRQCFGFYTPGFWSSLAYGSAEEKTQTLPNLRPPMSSGNRAPPCINPLYSFLPVCTSHSD